MRVLACDGIHEDGLVLMREAGWEVEISEPIKDPAVLAKKLEGVDALLVRSATAVTAESIANATQLKVIGRAGAGVAQLCARADADGSEILAGCGGDDSDRHTHRHVSHERRPLGVVCRRVGVDGLLHLRDDALSPAAGLTPAKPAQASGLGRVSTWAWRPQGPLGKNACGARIRALVARFSREHASSGRASCWPPRRR